MTLETLETPPCVSPESHELEMPDSHGLAAHQVLTCIYIFMKHHRQLFAYNANCNIHVLALFKGTVAPV
jgi:hypothetical protein